MNIKNTALKRIGVIVLCVALVCAVAGLDTLLAGFAGTGSEAGAAGGNGAKTASNPTVTYTFDTADDLNDFDMWYAPTFEPVGDLPAIHMTGSTYEPNWYINNGNLTFKKNDALFFNIDTLKTDGITKTVRIDKEQKQVTYKSGDQHAEYHGNYGIAVLDVRQYENFELEVDVKGDTHWTMVGFGAKGTVNGVFPSQKDGGYAFLVENAGDKGNAKLIGYDATVLKTTPWKEYAVTDAFLYNHSLTTHHYKIVVKNGVATFYMDNGQGNNGFLQSGTLTGYVGGYIYLAMNNPGDGFSNLKITDLDAATDATVTYTFDTVAALDLFDMWYMPVGRSTEDVPAISIEDADRAGNWYIDDDMLCFAHDEDLYKTPEELQAGVTMAVTVEGSEKEINYKTTHGWPAYSSNFGVALLQTREYTDFRLEVDVISNTMYSYVGFGAAGGSYGAHAGQSDGGYYFRVEDRTGADEGKGQARLGISLSGGGLLGLKSDSSFVYNNSRAYHHYIIEVVDGTVTVWLDPDDNPNRTLSYSIPGYAGGYIYLASNAEGGGFDNLTITDLSDGSDVINVSNTKRYTFDKASDLEKFDTWYAYSKADTNVNEPAIRVTDSAYSDNWYIDNMGTLSFKKSDLYAEPDAETKQFEVTREFELDGTMQSYTFKNENQWPDYNANFGIAVLNTREYENFILDVDIKPSGYHTIIGFGAKGGNYGVFSTQENGGYSIHAERLAGQHAAYAKVRHYDAVNGVVMTDVNTTLTNFMYDGTYRHLKVVVTDKTAYFYYDDRQTPITVKLADTYDGGYIYFAANNTAGGFDNIRITDLDAADIEITSLITDKLETSVEIDRSAGEALTESLPGMMDATDANGYRYRVPVKWASDTYRSYLDGDHSFHLANGATGWKNVTVNAGENAYPVTVINHVNEEGYNADQSRKYYFDHDNDLLDFTSQYSKDLGDDGMSGWDGILMPDEDYSNWTTGSGVLTNTTPNHPGLYTAQNRSRLYSLVLKDLNLYNFRVEMDYYHASNWWYTYLILGVQDPSHSFCYVSGDELEYTAATEDRLGGGIWVYVQQEGIITFAGATGAGTTQSYRQDVDGSTNLANYPTTRNQVHHLTIEVIDGVGTIQVDESGIYYFFPSIDAMGGLLGIGTQNHGGSVDNFQVTALDADGNAIDFDDATMGFRPEYKSDSYLGWVPKLDDDVFVWGAEYIP